MAELILSSFAILNNSLALDFCRIPIKDEKELKVIGCPIKFRNEKEVGYSPLLRQHNGQIT
jgi:hypothetical protein